MSRFTRVKVSGPGPKANKIQSPEIKAELPLGTFFKFVSDVQSPV